MTPAWEIERDEANMCLNVRINGVYVADGVTGERAQYVPPKVQEDYERWKKQLGRSVAFMSGVECVIG